MRSVVNRIQIQFLLIFVAFSFQVSAWAWPTSSVLQKRRQQQDQSSLWAIAEQQLGSFEALQVDSLKHRKVALESHLGDDKNLISFETAWNWQKEILQQQHNRLKQFPHSTSFLTEQLAMESELSVGGDRVLMLEHAPVYTLGTASDERYILPSTTSASSSSSASTATNHDIPIIRMDRGGEVTYHGPGQLVVYPILDLRHYRQDIHWYMRALEQVVLVACDKLPLTSKATRQDDTTGIWIDNCKIAAMGIKCSRWITQHGLAVNVEETSLSGFQGIVPCGLEGRKVGCLNQFLDQPLTVREFAPLLREALEEVFCVELVE